MQYIQQSNGIAIPRTIPLDLPQTLDCGQAFRWALKPGSSQRFCGIALGHYLEVEATAQHILFHCISLTEFLNIWAPYFDLQTDYTAIRTELSHLHPTLKKAIQYAPGIRILRQEPWEALCCFILSQNNNITRIKGIVQRLCEQLGNKLPGGFAFPTAQTLASCSAEDLAPIRSGFRAKYLIDAAQKIASGTIDLEALKTAPINDVRQTLMTIQGIGPKVAECVALYGLHRLEAFPLDVWMKRAMETLFPGMTAADFGPYAGIAQQYIFHYTRTCKTALTPD